MKPVFVLPAFLAARLMSSSFFGGILRLMGMSAPLVSRFWHCIAGLIRCQTVRADQEHGGRCHMRHLSENQHVRHTIPPLIQPFPINRAPKQFQEWLQKADEYLRFASLIIEDPTFSLRESQF
jgi:hypothetical protein